MVKDNFSAGTVSHSLRGVRSAEGGRVFQEVGLTKVAVVILVKRLHGYCLGSCQQQFHFGTKAKIQAVEKRE